MGKFLLNYQNINSYILYGSIVIISIHKSIYDISKEDLKQYNLVDYYDIIHDDGIVELYKKYDFDIIINSILNPFYNKFKFNCSFTVYNDDNIIAKIYHDSGVVEITTENYNKNIFKKLAFYKNPKLLFNLSVNSLKNAIFVQPLIDLLYHIQCDIFPVNSWFHG